MPHHRLCTTHILSLSLLLLLLPFCCGGLANTFGHFERDVLQNDTTFRPMIYASPTRLLFEGDSPSLTLSFLNRPDIFSFLGRYVEISEVEAIPGDIAPHYNITERFPLSEDPGFWNITSWNTMEGVYEPNKNVSTSLQLVQWVNFTTTLGNGASISIVYSLHSNWTRGTFPGSDESRTFPRGALHVVIDIFDWPFPPIENTTSNSSYPRFPMATFYTKVVGGSFDVYHSPDGAVNGLRMTNSFKGLFLLGSNYLLIDDNELVEPTLAASHLIAMYPVELRASIVVPRFNKSARCVMWLHPIEFELIPKPPYNPMPVIIAVCVLGAILIPLIVGIICVRRHYLTTDETLTTDGSTASSIKDYETELQAISTSPLLNEENDEESENENL